MIYFIFKSLISGILIAFISTIAKRSTFFGALLASLPITSILAMIWMYQENKNSAAISQLSLDIFWLVLPSLSFFLLLPVALKKGCSFYTALFITCLLTSIIYMLFIKIKALLF